MEGRVFIDGTDIYTAFGAFVAKDGYNGLLEYPSTKPVTINDWAEEDGIDPDLSELFFDKKEFSMTIAFSRSYFYIDAFFNFIQSSTYHEFVFRKIGITRKLRLVSCSSLDYAKSLSKVVIVLCDDSPMNGFVYVKPSSTLVGYNGAFMLDHVPLTEYGVRVYKGTMNTVMKPPTIKPLLERNLSTKNGVSYDSNVKAEGDPNRCMTSSKEITLNCLLVAKDTDEAWRNYFGLLYDLVRKNNSNDVTRECMRVLSVGEAFNEFLCFYSSSKVTESFFDQGRIWIKFSITLTTLKDNYEGGDSLWIDFDNMRLYHKRIDESIRYYIGDDGYLYKITDD